MIIALLVVVAGSGALLWVSLLGFTGKLPLNPWAGIRLPYTMSSEERWNRTHRAAGPIMIFAAVASLATGLAFVPFAAADAVPDGVVLAVVLVQAAMILLGVGIGTWVGLRRAKAEERTQD